MCSTQAQHPLELNGRICGAHGQGFMADTRVKLAAKVRVPMARQTIAAYPCPSTATLRTALAQPGRSPGAPESPPRARTPPPARWCGRSSG
jgi:hypothetical protein